MREATIFMNGKLAGFLQEQEPRRIYTFNYIPEYNGPDISLTMPKTKSKYVFNQFPPFFEGLLPEGKMLEGLLSQIKIDADDFFGQLIAVGRDLVGAVTVEEVK